MAAVVLARAARRDLVALDGVRAAAVVEALGLLEREPESGHLLRGPLRGLRSLRVGSYRVTYRLSADGATVRGAAIRHRSVAYESDPRPR